VNAAQEDVDARVALGELVERPELVDLQERGLAALPGGALDRRVLLGRSRGGAEAQECGRREKDGPPAAVA